MQAGDGQVGSRSELLGVADDVEDKGAANRVAANQQAIAFADDGGAAGDPVAVHRERLSARLAKAVQDILQLEVHDAALHVDGQSRPMNRDLAIDKLQGGQFLLDRLRVGATRAKGLAQLRLLLAQIGALLQQLVVGLVQVIDQQGDAGVVQLYVARAGIDQRVDFLPVGSDEVGPEPLRLAASRALRKAAGVSRPW